MGHGFQIPYNSGILVVAAQRLLMRILRSYVGSGEACLDWLVMSALGMVRGCSPTCPILVLGWFCFVLRFREAIFCYTSKIKRSWPIAWAPPQIPLESTLICLSSCCLQFQGQCPVLAFKFSGPNLGVDTSFLMSLTMDSVFLISWFLDLWTSHLLGMRVNLFPKSLRLEISKHL